jgi:TonB family protein
MRRLIATTAVLASAAMLAGASDRARAQAPAQDRVSVYVVGDTVTAPRLLPSLPIEVMKGKCKRPLEGRVALSFIVDESGTPRNITFLRVLGNDLDKLALHVVETDQFKPGMQNGAAVPVWQSAEVTMQACVEGRKDANGKPIDTIRPRSQPAQSLGTPPETPPQSIFTSNRSNLAEPNGQPSKTYKVAPKAGVSVPISLNNVEAQFSEEARRKRIDGTCILTFLVNAQGMPENIRVTQPLGHGLDEQALAAVNRYRFRPAMKDGLLPVPVEITVEINFRLYNH